MTGPAGAGRAVVVLLPGDVDDDQAPSGGNGYDRRVCRDLVTDHGWQVQPVAVPGSWPRPGGAARDALAGALATVSDGGVVLLDGLVACGVPEVVVPEAARLRTAVLVHLPLADETGLAPEVAAELDARERATLRAAAAVVVTSPWATQRLDRHGLDPARVHVAAPGVDPAPLAAGSGDGTELLCVAAVTPRKGQAVLVEALARVADLPWRCDLVGPLRDPVYVMAVRALISGSGLGDRVRLAGPLTGHDLERAYAAADLAVLASHAETYGMVVTEALARGIPVLATAVDALPDTLGRAPDGSLPGLLVPPGDAAALASALRGWLEDGELRQGLGVSARARRGMLDGWQQTSRCVDAVLAALSREPGGSH